MESCCGAQFDGNDGGWQALRALVGYPSQPRRLACEAGQQTQAQRRPARDGIQTAVNQGWLWFSGSHQPPGRSTQRG